MKITLLAISATLATLATASPSPSPFLIPAADLAPTAHHAIRSDHSSQNLSPRTSSSEEDEEDDKTPDIVLASELAESLASSDEDYDTRPDGLTDAEYLEDLAVKDAEDGGVVPPEKREARIPNDACGTVTVLSQWGRKNCRKGVEFRA